MPKDLELSLRIKADLQQAKQQVDALSKGVDGLGAASKVTATNLETTSVAIDKIETDLQQVQRDLQGTANTFNYVGKATYSFRNDMRSSAEQLKVASTESDVLDNNLKQLNGTTRQLGATQQQLDKTLRQGKNAQDQYARSVKNTNDKTKQAGENFKSFRGQAANIGYQLQDIAVQAQAGVNPTTILAQQGSQLVSAFNPLAGAAIAVGGALAGALIPNLFGADDAAAKLSETIRELNKSYASLGDDQRQKLIDDELTKQQTLNEQVVDTKNKIDELEAELQRRITRGTSGSLNGQSLNTDEVRNRLLALNIDLTREITTEKAKLATVNQQVADSEREIERIRGKDIADPKEQAAQVEQLIKQLQEEIDLYGKEGAELGKYIADKYNQEGAIRKTIISLYAEREAQRAATKAQTEARAEEEKAKRQKEAKARAAEDYVKALERQAAAIGKTREQIQALTAADKGLNDGQSKRAAAANSALNAQEDAKVLAQLQAELLKAQGQNQEQAQQAFIAKYRKMLDGMEPAARAEGEAIVEQLINLNGLQGKLDDAQRKIQTALNDQQRGETSLNTQREAGLITEADARERILELHRQTYDLLQQQRPVLEELSTQRNEIGVQAKKVLADLDAQAQLLLITVNELEQTLKNSLESGISDALQGLAKGTYTLREAINALATTVRDALIKMAADNIAQKITGSLFGGGKNSGQELSEGATKTTAAAAALTSSAALWNATAAQIKQAAASLAAANSSGGSSSSSGGSDYAGYLQLAAQVFAADGGHITGPGTATSDSIPAMLSNNEFVTRAAVVTQQGALDFLTDFNRRGMAALSDWSPVRHATGGLAGYPAPSRPGVSMPTGLSNSPAANNTTLQNAQNFYLIDDPERIPEALKSAKGKDSLLVVMGKNPQEFKSVMKIGG